LDSSRTLPQSVYGAYAVVAPLARARHPHPFALAEALDWTVPSSFKSPNRAVHLHSPAPRRLRTPFTDPRLLSSFTTLARSGTVPNPSEGRNYGQERSVGAERSKIDAVGRTLRLSNTDARSSRVQGGLFREAESSVAPSLRRNGAHHCFFYHHSTRACEFAHWLADDRGRAGRGGGAGKRCSFRPKHSCLSYF
jgi:hypothetical protein